LKKAKSVYHGHRFPAVVISCAVRWYFRFSSSLRNVEELLLERGVVVMYETIRCWCNKFGAEFARCAKAARPTPGSIWHLDERALVQMACLAEMLPIDMDALSIEQDGIPDSGRSSIFEPDH
jgi:transposase-like protein